MSRPTAHWLPLVLGLLAMIGVLAWLAQAALDGPRRNDPQDREPVDDPAVALDPGRTNPFTGDDAAIADGARLYAVKSCAGCHGSRGGGGMCPSLLDDTWVYGNDDAVLFHLLRHGSAGLRARGYTRLVQDGRSGDMPALGAILSEEETWKILAWIRAQPVAGATP